MFCCVARSEAKVERVFGVLFKRFQILYRPCGLFKVEDMVKIVEACIILPNMIRGEGPAGFTGSRSCRFRMESDDLDTPQEAQILVPNDEEAAGFRANHLNGIGYDAQNFELKNVLKSF